MKKLILMLLCVSLLFSGCGLIHIEITPHRQGKPSSATEPETASRPTEPPDTPPQIGSESKEQVLLLYIVGSNLESDSGLASYDIEEILDSGFDEDNLSVLICAGGASFWWTKEISNDECGIYQVNDGELTQVHTLRSDNMADPKTLTEFLDYGYTAYDADYYSLILWNHGGGAVLGFGLDENHGSDALSLQEMGTAFQNSKLISDGNRFEWVGFDACLMGMAEVANMLSDYANFLIASEETEAGTGWDYTCLETLSDGCHCDGLAASQVIIDSFEKFHETGFKYTPDYTLSAMDLSKVDPMITALDALVEVAQKDLIAGNYSKIAKLRDQAKSFGKISSNSTYDTVDLYDLSEKLVAMYPDEAKALQEAVEELVVYQATNVYGAHGVAVYFPYENKEYAPEWLQVYQTTGFSDTYTAFLRNFTKTLAGEQLTTWDIAEVVPVENEAVPGEYYVQLTPEQVENYGRAKYSIWGAEGSQPGCYICWINSYDVQLSEDGKLSSGFEGKRFFLGNALGDSLPCSAFETERNEEYVKYVTPLIIFYDTGGVLPETKVGFLHFRVDEEHPEGCIMGIYQDFDSDSTMFPNRDLLHVKDGMVIAPFLYSRTIVFREDGSVAPFDEWKSTSGTGATFVSKGDFTITTEDTEPGTEYCCLFYIKDTQGNYQFTNPVYIQY